LAFFYAERRPPVKEKLTGSRLDANETRDRRATVGACFPLSLDAFARRNFLSVDAAGRRHIRARRTADCDFRALSKGTTLAVASDVRRGRQGMRNFFYLSPPQRRRAAKRLVEAVCWLVAILLFIYAGHAALAQLAT
jgi:hypothetical protein